MAPAPPQSFFGPQPGKPSGEGSGRTLPGPPANRCENEASLPGASAPSLHFLLGRKDTASTTTWAHTATLSQDGGLWTLRPHPHSAKCLSVSGGR